VAIKGCNSLTAWFTQGVLPYQHGAGDVPQSQYILFLMGFFILGFLSSLWKLTPGDFHLVRCGFPFYQ